jgi:phosphoribosylaminoimidazolecarboxamide formyltransferase/IMP cyclohydrolase
MRNIERAILSVSDKTGIIELARALHARGVEILSTGGTAKHLADNGVAVTPIATWSGAPEILGGRVKTLTPRVFGAILHDRDNDAHRGDVERLSIPPIDLVVVNLYPFEATIAREGVTVDEAIEQIDIGGPSMLRAAAKNHKHVLPLPDPSLYADFLRELESGAISDDFRRRCAVAVFEKTSRYDAAIAKFLGARRAPLPVASIAPVASVGAHSVRPLALRYGENPQQSATFHGGSFTQLQGKELSYNNLLDLDAAMRLAHAFREPAAAVIKHTNPCGVARMETYAEALRAAVEADPVSAYGGIVGANREFDDDAARVIESLFLEVIVAPSFSEGARAILAKKKNLRLIEAPPPQNDVELRSAAGGILEQSVDRIGPRENWRVVTERQPSEDELRGLEFAWIVCAHVKSNAIVITSEAQSIGIGAGQMSRVDAAKLAVTKATRPTAGAYAASDAFFPFRDGLDILAGAGVRAVIQPGGSVRDAEVIAAANERGVAMVLTGERHFRH